jgi:hypothetical protein
MIPKILEKGGEGGYPDLSAQIERFGSSLAFAAQLYFEGPKPTSRKGGENWGTRTGGFELDLLLFPAALPKQHRAGDGHGALGYGDRKEHSIGMHL